MNIFRRALAKLSKIETRRALGLVWESGARWLVANTALLFVKGLMPLPTLYLTKLVLDAIVAALGMDGQSVSTGSLCSLRCSVWRPWQTR
jgi:ATP-binding cassette subfamily B protein